MGNYPSGEATGKALNAGETARPIRGCGTLSRVKMNFSLLFSVSAVQKKGGPGAGAPGRAPRYRN